jgi:excisionase family DNA binding protein
MYTHQIAETLSLSEVANRIGVSERTIQRWVAEHKFIRPVTGAGMQWRFNRQKVAEWIKGADDLAGTMRELVAVLSHVSRDPDETVQGRKWAAARLVELQQGDPMALHAIERLASRI